MSVYPSPLKILYRAILELLPDKWAIQIIYHRNFDRFADLRAPKTFSEKINWRKLYQRDPRFTLFSDKAAVKDEVARMIGREHIIPTLWEGESPGDLPFDDLAPPYVIKVNHGYGGNIFVRLSDDVDKAKIRAALHHELSRPHGTLTRQWAYHGIHRKILIERMLDILGNGRPEDFKFFVYHGRAHFIQVNVDRWGKDQIAFFDRDWAPIATPSDSRAVDQPIPKPPFLNEMIGIAEKIGSIFDFVRVDLYYASNTVYFGETTFYPSSGYTKVITGPMDEKFGEPWIITAPER